MENDQLQSDQIVPIIDNKRLPLDGLLDLDQEKRQNKHRFCRTVADVRRTQAARLITVQHHDWL